MDQVDFSAGDLILHKKVSDVYVPCMLSCRSMSISLHADGTLVVMCKVVFLDDVSLYVDEMNRPQVL